MRQFYSFNRDFNLEDVAKQAIDFMASIGISPRGNLTLILDGEIHRFQTMDDTSGQQSGAYCIHSDGWPAGFVQDWRKGIKENWRYDISGLDLDDEKRSYFNSEEYIKKCEAQRKKNDAARRARQAECSEKARALWPTLPFADGNHPYLQRKNVKPYSVRFNTHDHSLAVPILNINGLVISIQWIPADEGHHKTFYEGASLEGGFFSWRVLELEHDYNGIIMLGEGYATMAKLYELTGYPIVAAMSCHRLGEVAEIIHSAYPQAKIIMAADNDWETAQKIGKNPGVSYAKAVGDKKLAVGMIVPDFQQNEHGSDWDDFALIHGDEITAEDIQRKIQYIFMPQKVKDMTDKNQIQSISAQALRAKPFAPIKWAVPGLIPAGVSILGGGPKVGKSIFALNIGVGVAIGGCVLGKIQLEQGDVLYLALEDNERRLQDRLLNIPFLREQDDIHRLILTTVVPRQHDGGMEYIKWWLSEHPTARLVIIDTLQRFRKQLSGRGNVYAEDYDVISELKVIADTFDVAILVVHHLRKMSDKESLASETSGDWVNTFSGSIGLSGSADALFIIKRNRGAFTAKMFRTGRDVEEAEFDLRLDNFGWYLQEEADSFILPTWQTQILNFIKEHGSVTPAELASGFNLNINTAQGNLRRMEKEGRIRKSGYGKYELNPDYSK